MRCNAKNRQGNQCGKHAVPGKTKCRNHGGATPSGIASPHWKHGRREKYLPKNLVGKYTEALKDVDLISLRDEIALVDARINTLLEALDKDSATNTFGEIRNEWKAFIDGQRIISSNQASDTQRQAAQTRVADALRSLNELIETGSNEQGTWDKLFEAMEQRRRLSASEAKRLSDMSQFITAEKAMALVFAILGIVRGSIISYKEANKVPDNKLLQEISEGIRRLTSIQGGVSSEVIDAD